MEKKMKENSTYLFGITVILITIVGLSRCSKMGNNVD